MTRRTNARIAGFTFLIYIIAGLSSMALYGRAAGGEGTAAKLAAIAQHPTDIGIVIVLGLVQVFCALVLAVTLHALTRQEDPDVALMGMICRVSEGLISAFSIPGTLALQWLAAVTGPGANGLNSLSAPNALDLNSAHTLAAYLMRNDVAFTATFFAIGSLLFAWLFLRGRMIPTPLAWLGVIASALLVIGLPLQLVGVIGSPLTSIIWLPMLVFEVPFGFWLIIKGVAAPPGPVAATLPTR